MGSLLNRLLNADVLSPPTPAPPSLIALLLYGWTDGASSVANKVLSQCTQLQAEKSGGCHLVCSSSWISVHDSARQRGCHQVGVRRLSPLRRAPSVAVRQPHKSQHSASSTCGSVGKLLGVFSSAGISEVTEVGEEEHGGAAEARWREENDAVATGEIINLCEI